MGKEEKDIVVDSDDSDDDDDDDKGTTTLMTLFEKLFPKTDDKGGEIGIGFRIWNFIVPRFSMKTFTFWFSLWWLGWNCLIFVMYIGVKNKLTYPMDCTMIDYYCGSITSYQKYAFQYYRPFLSIFTADSIGTTALGFIVLWMHGFEYEHLFKTKQVVVVMFVSG